MDRPSWDEALGIVKLLVGTPESLAQLDQQRNDTWRRRSCRAQGLLRAGKPLPDELAGWVADVLADVLKHGEVERRRAVAPPQLFDRRSKMFFAMLAVEWLDALGIKPTRNRVRMIGLADDPEEASEKGGSGCDAVGVVLGMKYGAVARAWGRRTKR